MASTPLSAPQLSSTPKQPSSSTSQLDKRRIISGRLRRLLAVGRDASLYRQLLDAGADRAALMKWSLGQRKDPAASFDPERTAYNVDRLLSMGGAVSGGAALACATGAFFTKDIDFFFKDDVQYMLASLAVMNDPAIDVNLYIDTPHELHDMAVVMCDLDASGVHMTPQCQSALDTGISDLYIASVIYPIRTAARILKYHARLGTKFAASEVIAFCALYKLPPETWQALAPALT